MNDKVLRDIIGLKLKIMDKVIETLPEPVGGSIKEFERSLISAMHEVAEGYSQKNKMGKDNPGNVKQISID